MKTSKTAEYEERLDSMIQAIFEESDRINMTMTEMAKVSGLHINTVRNLNYYNTRRPQLRTILKLA